MAKIKTAKFTYLNLPAALFASTILSDAEKFILADIKSYPYDYNLTYPTIAKKFNKNRHTIMRSIQRLSGNLGMITSSGKTKNRGLKLTEKGLSFWDTVPKIKTEQKTPKVVSAPKVQTTPVNGEAVRLSKLFIDLILQRHPEHRHPDLNKWAGEIDRMIRIDKRTPERIEAVLRWSQADSFWQTNILSPEKLRKQFDQLEIKQQTKGNDYGTGTNRQNTAPKLR